MLNSKSITKVIGASSLGTLIEWYDFYIFGSLAKIISEKFFPANQSTSALLSTLAIFAAGFVVRPFGALVFGNIGDKLGRKYTFLLTLILMGISTFAIGLIPSYAQIGFWAPVLILILRLIQGLALGGEYGGAATYVAEHAPVNKIGFFTSFIQTTATLGLFLSLGVILFTKKSMSADDFNSFGWRIPFLVSIFLVIVSIYIRLKMHESPAFNTLKTEGKISKNPLKESFTNEENLKYVLLALFGAVMGQGVVWYTGQFYVQSFLENACKINFEQSRTILLIAIIFATPFFIFWGWLSDKIGRKWIILTGILLAIICYKPIFNFFYSKTHGQVISREIKFQKRVYYKDKNYLLYKKVEYTYNNNIIGEIESVDTIPYLNHPLVFGDKKLTPELEKIALKISESKTLPTKLYVQFSILVFILIFFVTMVYGPIAAFLVELFPTKIRYTSMSLPYHIGNGIFGGMVPFISTLIVENTKTASNPTGNPMAGLWYPIVVGMICFVIGSIYLKNKNNGRFN